jgi:ABC-type transport system substrate-binding protein
VAVCREREFTVYQPCSMAEDGSSSSSRMPAKWHLARAYSPGQGMAKNKPGTQPSIGLRFASRGPRLTTARLAVVSAHRRSSPNKRLKVKVSTRDFQAYKDPAVILVDQLNKVYFDADLKIVESSVWFGRMVKKNYAVRLNLTGAAVDDPDSMLRENYKCESENNFIKYCNPEVEALLDAQSREADIAKRKQLVWAIERKLAEDVANPIISHNVANTCWHPYVKGHVQHKNSIYNNWRFENVWLGK